MDHGTYGTGLFMLLAVLKGHYSDKQPIRSMWAQLLIEVMTYVTSTKPHHSQLTQAPSYLGINASYC